MTLRTMKAGDIAGGLRLCRASGWNQLEEDWRVFTDTPGSGALLLEKDGKVAGTAAFVRYESLAWIAMMLVDPAERGAGLGTSLLKEALAGAGDASSIGLDATPLGEKLYRRFDFVEHYRLARVKATIEAGLFGKPEGEARPMHEDDLAAVRVMDREVFGVDRSFLLARLFARAPECAWVAGDTGGIQGYSFGRPGYRYFQVGPIVASGGRTARTLAACALSQLGGRVCALDVPMLDGDWLAWLNTVGLAEERPFIRMFLRGHTHPGIPARQYAICGPEFA